LVTYRLAMGQTNGQKKKGEFGPERKTLSK